MSKRTDRRGKKSKVFEWSGIIVFPVTFALITQIAVLVYDYVQEKVSVGQVAVIMIIVILSISVIATVIDVVRRKLTIINPVNKILDATDKIASGDLTARVDIESRYGRYSKYDLIAENVNKMATELSKNQMISSDFISSVSHEMKTPLSVIKNYVKALSNENLDGETREKYNQILNGAIEKLDGLIINVLKLTKLENSQIIPEKEKIDLHDTVAETVFAYDEKIQEKQIELNCEIDEVTVFTDRGCVDLIVNNLISNAIKFTPQKGSVFVSLTEENGYARFSVKDTGIGISKEVGARIFDKFYQVDKSRKQEGNGLGLSLVKKAIDLLGGKIEVKSEEGKGSAFTVMIKL